MIQKIIEVQDCVIRIGSSTETLPHLYVDFEIYLIGFGSFLVFGSCFGLTCGLEQNLIWSDFEK